MKPPIIIDCSQCEIHAKDGHTSVWGEQMYQYQTENVTIEIRNISTTLWHYLTDLIPHVDERTLSKSKLNEIIDEYDPVVKGKIKRILEDKQTTIMINPEQRVATNGMLNRLDHDLVEQGVNAMLESLEILTIVVKTKPENIIILAAKLHALTLLTADGKLVLEDVKQDLEECGVSGEIQKMIIETFIAELRSLDYII